MSNRRTPPGEYAKLAVIGKIDTAPNDGILYSHRGSYRIGILRLGKNRWTALFSMNGQENKGSALAGGVSAQSSVYG